MAQMIHLVYTVEVPGGLQTPSRLVMFRCGPSTPRTLASDTREDSALRPAGRTVLFYTCYTYYYYTRCEISSANMGF